MDFSVCQFMVWAYLLVYLDMSRVLTNLISILLFAAKNLKFLSNQMRVPRDPPVN